MRDHHRVWKVFFLIVLLIFLPDGNLLLSDFRSVAKFFCYRKLLLERKGFFKQFVGIRNQKLSFFAHQHLYNRFADLKVASKNTFVLLVFVDRNYVEAVRLKFLKIFLRKFACLFNFLHFGSEFGCPIFLSLSLR